MYLMRMGICVWSNKWRMFSFDEIGSVLKIKELQRTKRELFESLQMYYRVFFLGEDVRSG